MKKFFSMVAAGCLLSLLVVGTTRAQEPGTSMRVSIPFDFTVKGRTLPAGEYEVRRILDEPIGYCLETCTTNTRTWCLSMSLEFKTPKALANLSPGLEQRQPWEDNYIG